MRPRYIIVAGVNGAGKSTLYSSQPWLFEGTRRINADEWLKANGGDWRSPADNVKELWAVLKNLIDKAHAKGYEVTVLYVTLDSPETAIDRVADRVKKGGHGVDEDLIRKRYDRSKETLKVIAEAADNVLMFDNSKAFTQTYERRGNLIIYDIRKTQTQPTKNQNQHKDNTQSKHL